MSEAKPRLSLDFSSLFPKKVFRFNDLCSIEIKALGLEQYASFVSKFQEFVGLLKEKGINETNWKETDNAINLAHIVLHNFPELLEEASGVHIDDLRQLPIETVLSLINTVIDVNMESKENLLGNLVSLVQRLPFLQKAESVK